jgi:hypothetical protein
MGTTVVVQKDALAQDKSTSITCNDSLHTAIEREVLTMMIWENLTE